jgi:hypothetical protein
VISNLSNSCFRHIFIAFIFCMKYEHRHLTWSEQISSRWGALYLLHGPTLPDEDSSFHMYHNLCCIKCICSLSSRAARRERRTVYCTNSHDCGTLMPADISFCYKTAKHLNQSSADTTKEISCWDSKINPHAKEFLCVWIRNWDQTPRSIGRQCNPTVYKIQELKRHRLQNVNRMSCDRHWEY